MAGEAFNPQTTPGVESADWGATVRQLIQEEASKMVAGQGQQPAPAAPVETPRQLAIDGQTYTFKNDAELSAAVQNAIGKMREALAQQQLTAASTPKPEPAAPEGFSEATFIEKFKESPKTGMEYVLEHSDLAKALREKLGQVDQMQSSMAAYQFYAANRDFPGGPEWTAALERARQELGAGFDAKGLTAAWHYVKSQAAQAQAAQWQAQQQVQQQAQGQNFAPQGPYAAPQAANPAAFNPALAGHPAFNGGGYGGAAMTPGMAAVASPPPVLPRGGGQSTEGGLPQDLAFAAENMSDQQLAQLIDRLSRSGR